MRSTRKRLFALSVAVLLALGVTPFLVAATSGSNKTGHLTALTCGQTVTASVALTADLTGCAGRGLVVGANGITINLNGHVISGTGLTARDLQRQLQRGGYLQRQDRGLRARGRGRRRDRHHDEHPAGDRQ